jgi:hypothetical protein
VIASNFDSIVIEKAKIACKNSDQAVKNHFADAGKMVGLGSGSQQIVKNHFVDISKMISQDSNLLLHPLSFPCPPASAMLKALRAGKRESISIIIYIDSGLNPE